MADVIKYIGTSTWRSFDLVPPIGRGSMDCYSYLFSQCIHLARLLAEPGGRRIAGPLLASALGTPASFSVAVRLSVVQGWILLMSCCTSASLALYFYGCGLADAFVPPPS